MTGSANPVAPSPADVWAAGDYASVCDRMIPRLGERLVTLAGIEDGQAVLDVAAGSGNATLPAARAGAAVTALDITPSLLEIGAGRATAAGVDVAWVEGSADAMPFADASFDRVLSCVGVQFCADHDATTSELLRVCRSGGRIALISWTPEGFIGQVLAAVAQATGAASSGSSPLDWGRETVLDAWFKGTGELSTSRSYVDMPASSAHAWVNFMAESYGPLLRARITLGERGWQPLRERLCEIAAAHDTRDSDGFAGRAEYLTATIDR